MVRLMLTVSAQYNRILLGILDRKLALSLYPFENRYFKGSVLLGPDRLPNSWDY